MTLVTDDPGSSSVSPTPRFSISTALLAGSSERERARRPEIQQGTRQRQHRLPAGRDRTPRRWSLAGRLRCRRRWRQHCSQEVGARGRGDGVHRHRDRRARAFGVGQQQPARARDHHRRDGRRTADRVNLRARVAPELSCDRLSAARSSSFQTELFAVLTLLPFTGGTPALQFAALLHRKSPLYRPAGCLRLLRENTSGPLNVIASSPVVLSCAAV